MKIKYRKMVLHRIYVSINENTFRPILVTPAQLAQLKATPKGKRFFLSHRYCHTGGDFWVIRTKDGLQSIPNPYIPNSYRGGSNDSISHIQEPSHRSLHLVRRQP